MLIEFRFKNYRSFRDEAIMSMEAMGLGSKKDCLIHYKSQKILPTVAELNLVLLLKTLPVVNI